MPGEKIENLTVRFRTVGDITCTAPVLSEADTVEKIIMETASTVITERGETRLDDQVSDASMEQRKKEGYTGVWIGSSLSSKIDENKLRYILVLILLGVGIKLILN